MSRILAILICLSMVFGLSACDSRDKSSIPTFSQFDILFVNQLPREQMETEKCSDLYVNQSHSYLADPNYVIAFNLQFDNSETFQAYANTIHKEGIPCLQKDGKRCYLFQWSRRDFEEYTNDKIYDGDFFTYEIICINEEKCQIGFLFAHVWDYWKDEQLVSWLEQLYEVGI